MTRVQPTATEQHCRKCHVCKQVKGLGALSKFLFILRRNLSSGQWKKCARLFCILPNFVEPDQTSKVPSSRLEAGQSFGSVKSARYFNSRATIWRTTSIKKIISLFIGEPFRQKTAKIFHFYAAIKPRDAAWQSVPRILRMQLLWLPSLCLAESPGLNIAQIVYPGDWNLVVNKTFAGFSMRPRLTNFDEIFAGENKFCQPNVLGP